MESCEDIYERICRVCLSYETSDNMVSLRKTTNSRELTCYGKAVQIFTNINLNEDYLPNQMCQKCLSLLKKAIIFRKTCENSQEILKNLARNCDALDVSIAEKVREFILNKQYNFVEGQKNSNSNSGCFKDYFHKKIKSHFFTENVRYSNLKKISDYLAQVDSSRQEQHNTDNRSIKSSSGTEDYAENLLESIENQLQVKVSSNKVTKTRNDKVISEIVKQPFFSDENSMQEKKLFSILGPGLPTDINNVTIAELNETSGYFFEKTDNIDEEQSREAHSSECEDSLDIIEKSLDSITSKTRKRLKQNIVNQQRQKNRKAIEKLKYLKEVTKRLKKKREYGKHYMSVTESKSASVKPPIRDHHCETCNKMFSKRAYERHRQIHEGYKYVCEVCAKGHASLVELQCHRGAIHGIGNRYSCDKCTFKAFRRFDIDEHQRFHTGERPFACDKCGLTFRRKFHWKKHLQFHKEKTVQCPSCPMKFFIVSAMKEHHNNVHHRVYVFQCSECDATYSKPKTVRRHLLDRHGIAREMQGKIKRITIAKSMV